MRKDDLQKASRRDRGQADSQPASGTEIPKPFRACMKKKLLIGLGTIGAGCFIYAVLADEVFMILYILFS